MMKPFAVGLYRAGLVAAAMLFATIGPHPALAAPDRNAALDYLGRGSAAYQVGDFVAATQDWSQAIAICHAIGATDLEVQALGRRGEAYRLEGYFRDAAVDLRAAIDDAERVGDKSLIAASSGALGNLYFLAKRSRVAEPLLLRSRKLAAEAGNQDIVAASANDLGNLYAAAKQPGQAAAAYNDAINAAGLASDELLAAVAETNAARLAFRQNSPGEGAARLNQAVSRLERLPASYATGLALVSAGAAALEDDGQLSADSQRIAYEALRKASEIGDASHSPVLSSLALGSLGRLYERGARFSDAEAFTDRALFAAQQSTAPELLFRWEWQRARIAHSQGQDDTAITQYRRAAADLKTARPDIPIEYRSGRSSYLTTYGPFYREFADLLLRKAAASPQQSASLLREARDTVESLKESELQDYFRDSCVTSFEAKRRSIDQVAPNTAVLYPIVLPDRLELLVSIGQQEHQFTLPLPAARLRQEAKQFRLQLEKRTTNEYLPLARQLYGEMIRPIEPLLTANQVQTLVVVPDDVLRLVPFAALNDGEHFLVERYAIAVAPSLHLVDPEPLTQKSGDALVFGISDSVQGFSSLPHVESEVADVHKLNGGKVLLNQQFERATFIGELKGEPYNIVHIASHGEFGDDPSQTFVLAYDAHLTMDDLEQSIKFGEYRTQALELLTLEACETAAGDDRAALGLAGIALKAGARSALASLWFISDEASGQLATSFYEALKSGHVSKAQALQAAQRELIANPLYSHPAYWAPFLLIGNWL